MYTYILKDRDRGIYKIGKTKDPYKRFKSLCEVGKIAPIALIHKDIEKALHKKFSKNRVEHEDFKGNGGTEWFKKGGSFTDFINTVDTGKTLPYITPHMFSKFLVKSGSLRIADASLNWEIDDDKYAYQNIGINILHLLGYVSLNGKSLLSKDPGITFRNGSIAISEEVLFSIRHKYEMHMASVGFADGLRDSIDDNTTLEKFHINEHNLGSEVFLLIKLVL